jgi:hypothetical protein
MALLERAIQWITERPQWSDRCLGLVGLGTGAIVAGIGLHLQVPAAVLAGTLLMGSASAIPLQ